MSLPTVHIHVSQHAVMRGLKETQERQFNITIYTSSVQHKLYNVTVHMHVAHETQLGTLDMPAGEDGGKQIFNVLYLVVRHHQMTVTWLCHLCGEVRDWGEERLRGGGRWEGGGGRRGRGADGRKKCKNERGAVLSRVAVMDRREG